MRYRFFLLFIALIWVTGCNLLTQSNESDKDATFFPLSVGKKWQYQIVKSDFDINNDSFFFPKKFTVEIVQMKTINDINYYEIKNYFLPGPSLPEPAYMRIDGSQVFVLISNKEYLLYSFDSADSTKWHLPMYANPTDLYDCYTHRIQLNSDEAQFLWWHGTNFGRSEAYWTDMFQKGIGRTRILSFSQAYGEVVWELIR